ncbi:MAG: hypothetical protein NXI30_04035 [bacterium]|nr:hypothetical protein [bacterium]
MAELRPYLGAASKFVSRNLGHQAVQAGLLWCERLLSLKCPLAAGVVRSEAAALADAGVAPQQLLEVALAVYLLAEAEPERFGRLPDRDGLTVLGMEITRLRERYGGCRRFRKEVDLALGGVVWEGLGALLTNAVHSEQKAWTTEARLRESMAFPLPGLELKKSLPNEPNQDLDQHQTSDRNTQGTAK